MRREARVSATFFSRVGLSRNGFVISAPEKALSFNSTSSVSNCTIIGAQSKSSAACVETSYIQTDLRHECEDFVNVTCGVSSHDKPR